MAEYIEREALLKNRYNIYVGFLGSVPVVNVKDIDNAPAADVAEVVRCHDCIHAVPLERNCELNTCQYMHCNLWRGDETKNVWHKYQRFYKDYSIVEHDDFCSYGERKDT